MSLPVCKFYELNQTCRFGNQCKFYHSQRPPPRSNLAHEDHDNASGVAASPQSTLPEVPEPRSTGNSESFSQNDLGLDPEISGKSTVQATRSRQQTFPHKSGNRNGADVQKKTCSYFARGWCRYGRYCKFIHHTLPPRLSQRATTVNLSSDGSDLKDTPHLKPREESTHDESKDDAKDGSNDPSSNKASTSILAPSSNTNGKQQRQAGKICVYYKSGGCKKGANCKFLHKTRSLANRVQEAPSLKANSNAPDPGKLAASKPINSKPQSKIYGRNQCQPFNSQALKVFSLSELDEIGWDKIRSEEIEAIKRRFPKDKITHKNDRSTFQANLKFAPSDPDWPFDVKEFTLVVVIHPSYPQQPLSVTLAPDQNLPTTVQRYVEVSIEEWIINRHEQLVQQGKVELVFRAFLRWLDRTIEEITTEALLQLKRELTAKAAGLEFIPSKKLQAKFQSAKEAPVEDVQEEVEPDTDEKSDDITDDEDQDSSSEDEEGKEESEENQTLELQPQQRGTEISLKYLQLKENAAAILFQRLKLILQCNRCKGHSDLYVAQGNVVSVSCNRCNQDMYVTYRPGLLHQFSSVLGYLDVDGCQAFDLVLQDCRSSVSCMACNKQTTIDGIVTGQVIEGWCKACNAKFKLATEAVKLTQLAPSGIDTSSVSVIKAASSKPKKPPKDPSIREGYPLPDFGTCKHYKQSYRWLRFPCCGKAYPCDVCHDKKEDHEMTLANRMICGHCCKEQNYSASRPCSSCGEHMTKVHSAHWEGGSGCRDKISMSKGDIQKYKNMNKTVSNKKKMESGHKKKNTKLRHV